MSKDETPCPVREDGQHCNCWYDGEACCACAAPAVDPETPRVTIPRPEHPVQFVISADPAADSFSWATTLLDPGADKAAAHRFIYRALAAILKASLQQRNAALGVSLKDMSVPPTIH